MIEKWLKAGNMLNKEEMQLVNKPNYDYMFSFMNN